ncbi:MAG: hypothetical protein ACP5LQ_05320 [Candidatus Methanodesulfokora sp.]
MEEGEIASLAILLFFVVHPLLLLADDGVMVVEVSRDGWARISEKEHLNNPEVELVTDHPEMVLVLDQDGAPLNYSQNGKFLYIESLGEVNITYYTPDLTYKEGIVWTLNISNRINRTIIVRLPEGHVFLGCSTPDFRMEGDSYVFNGSPLWISYVLSEEIPMREEGSSLPYLVFSIIAIILLVSALFAMRKKRMRRPLSHLEIRIIDLIGDKQLTLEDLYREIGDSVEVRRSIRRLISSGFIKKDGEKLVLTKQGRRIAGVS